MLVKTDCKVELVLCIFIARKNLRSVGSSQVHVAGMSQKYAAAMGCFTSAWPFPGHRTMCGVSHGVTNNHTDPGSASQDNSETSSQRRLLLVTW